MDMRSQGEGSGLWQPGKVLDHTRHMFCLLAVTSSDCYVTLNLPTASSHMLQTRTVKNSRNPVWNQNFHFRIHRQLKVDQASNLALSLSPCLPVCHSLPCLHLTHLIPVAASLCASFQNVMELKVFDHDLVTKDDPVLSVLFDVGTLQIGTQHQSFSLGTQVKLSKVGVPSAGAGVSEPPLLQGGTQESQVTSPRSGPVSNCFLTWSEAQLSVSSPGSVDRVTWKGTVALPHYEGLSSLPAHLACQFL